MRTSRARRFALAPARPRWPACPCVAARGACGRPRARSAARASAVPFRGSWLRSTRRADPSRSGAESRAAWLPCPSRGRARRGRRGACISRASRAPLVGERRDRRARAAHPSGSRDLLLDLDLQPAYRRTVLQRIGSLEVRDAASLARSLASRSVIRRCNTSRISRWTSAYVHALHHFDIASNCGGSNGGKVMIRGEYCIDVQYDAR